MNSQDISLSSHNWKTRFFSIWVGQTVSLLGTSLAQFAIVWHLTQQTGSATVLAMASLAGMLPQIVLGPVIGALVDRWNRRMVLIAADAINIVTTLALALLFAAGAAQVWHIYAALLLRSASSSFRDSAMGASIAMLAPQEQFARLQGINQARMGLMSVLSAPLGALLLALTPIQNILHADWLTTLFAIAPLLVFTIPQPEKHPAAKATSVFQDMKDGLAFVLGWRGLSILILMAMLINLLLTPTFALTPLLVTKFFNGGAAQLAGLEMAMGVGVILGGLGLGVWGGFKKRIFTAMLGLMGMGAGVLLVGMAPAALFAVALAGMFLTGVANPITNGSIGAIMQSMIPANMQGRVFSLLGTGAMIASPLGMIVAGPLSDAVGVRVWFVIGGVACIGLAVLCNLIPAVMNIELHTHESAPSQS